MEFRYVFIVQDILGLLIAFLYSRILFLSIKLVFAKGFTWSIIRVVLHQILMVSAGVFLVASPWAFNTLVWFVGLVAGAIIIVPKRK